MNRRQEREFALQLLFALEFNMDSAEALVDRMDAKSKKKYRICSENGFNISGT